MEQPEVTISILQGIGVSVTAGLIVLLMVGISKLIWWWFVCNLWLKLSCRHITDISGIWISEDGDDSARRREEMILKQYGWKVRGEISYQYTEAANKTNKVFLFDGIFRNNILSVTYWDKNRKQKGTGSFSLELTGDGDKLDGKYIFFATSRTTLETGNYCWERKK